MQKQFLENYHKFITILEEIYGEGEDSNLALYRQSAFLDDFNTFFMVTNVEAMSNEEAVKKGNEWLIEQCKFLEENKERIKEEKEFLNKESMISNEYKLIRLALRTKRKSKIYQTDYIVKVLQKYFKQRPSYIVEKLAEFYNINTKSQRKKRTMIAYEFVRELDKEKIRNLFAFF